MTEFERDTLDRVTGHLETWANDHSDERTSEIDAAVYCARQLLRAEPPVQSGVRPLEWQEDALTPGLYLADAGGSYQIEARIGGFAVIGGEVYKFASSLEEGKAIAQPDYERRHVR